ncbi:hypothetical protein [Gluconacetobacter tumulisoli]|uniref:Uncharacterized protein n=1 Tax=Gluconacetobacter tumulisoli TaxID=1286189 RepID=A0A7W4K4Y8_9PROT|nr:hypothetical protein [Gluconacetobacter tumulisoli]MBB2200473.1 hypothetical protein [Gluconacetobacter tumulisoli]
MLPGETEDMTGCFVAETERFGIPLMWRRLRAGIDDRWRDRVRSNCRVSLVIRKRIHEAVGGMKTFDMMQGM